MWSHPKRTCFKTEVSVQFRRVLLYVNEITGRVTSIGHSQVCGCPIGLAYVHPDTSKVGDCFEIKLSDGHRLMAEVASLPFYDPDNTRQEL